MAILSFHYSSSKLELKRLEGVHAHAPTTKTHSHLLRLRLCHSHMGSHALKRVSENEREGFLALKLYCPGVTSYIGSAKAISKKGRRSWSSLVEAKTEKLFLLVFLRTMVIFFASSSMQASEQTHKPNVNCETY